MKKTVVIGASENPERYAWLAVNSLLEHKHEVHAVGLKEGNIGPVKIHKGFPEFEDVNTVSLYVGPRHQDYWKDYILSLKPERVIFNPGTENDALEALLEKNNIKPVHACTLVMLSIGNY